MLRRTLGPLQTSIDYVDSHRTGRSRHAANACLERGRIRILDFHFRQLAKLRLGDCSDFVLVGTRRTGAGLTTDLQTKLDRKSVV